MKSKLLFLLFAFGFLLPVQAQTVGEDCANPIDITTFPYTDSGDTNTFGNNHLGNPGTACQTTDNYLDGNEVVYHFSPTIDLGVIVEVSDLVDEYVGVFVYEDCADIGANCFAAAVNANTTNPITIPGLVLLAGQDYYFVIATDPMNGPQTTSYTFELFCDTPPDPVGDANQNFCVGDTLDDLNVAGTDLTWYILFGTNYFPITDPTTYDLDDGETYYVTQTVNGCESDMISVTVTRTPGPPVADPLQTFCLGETLQDLDITGQNITWYSNAAATVQIPETTPLDDGFIYRARQTVGGCLSDFIEIEVERFPLTPVGEEEQVFCAGQTIANLIVGGQNLTWYSDAAGNNSIADPDNTLLTDGTSYWVSQTIDGCESALLEITAELIEIPEGAANQGFCPGMTVADLEVDGNNLTWYEDAAGTIEITDPSTFPLTTGGVYYVSQSYGPNCESALLAVSVTPLTNDECTYITVSEQYNYNELVKDVLIDNPCAYVDNVIGITGIDYPGCNQNGIGYFKNYNPNFPMESGIVLMTKDIEDAPGPNTFIGSSCPVGVWLGDQEPIAAKNLLDYMNNNSHVGGISSYNNASILEFDFLPYSDSISFNFIFASDEYVGFECSQFKDGFAFFLEDKSSGNVENLAVVPGTNNIPGVDEVPINISTINEQSCITGSCLEQNPAYFYGCYPNGANSAISFNGHTVKMTASSTVTPLNMYRMKLIVANAGDAGWQSAVFIEEGSFYLGFELGEDFTFDDEKVDCDTESVEIGYQSSSPVATYQWYIYSDAHGNFIPLPEETDHTLTVTETGTYQLGINLGGSCEMTNEIYVEIGVTPVAPDDPIEFFVCQPAPNPGTATFDLTLAEPDILDGQQDVSLTWHEDEDDAEDGVNEITNPQSYTNTTPFQQEVYVRMESDLPGNCYTIVPVMIIVGVEPDIPDSADLDPLTVCAEPNVTDYVFDLTDAEAAILAGLNPNDYTWAFYESPAAIPDTPIAAPENYQVNTNTTIWVQVVGNDGCFNTTSFELLIHPVVQYNQPDPLVVCDEGAANGVAPFDLSLATNQIAGGASGYSVTYYLTEAEAELGDPNDELSSPYTNTTSPYAQTIYFRIRDNATDCYAVDQLDLVVEEAPSAFEPDPLIFCDPNNDGWGSFILTDLDDEITGGAAGVSVSYHLTLPDAENDVLPLPSPYPNDTQHGQTIYALVQSPGVDCFNIVEVELVVLPSPQPLLPSELDPLVECDYNENGSFIFDLTEREPDILSNETSPGNFTVTYYETQQDADDNTNPIGVPTAYQATGAVTTIYVVVEGLNGCQKQTSFELHIVPLPEVFNPQPLELCDDNNPGDEQEEFNLELATLDITGGNTALTVTYHETQAEADNGDNPLTSPYTNSENNQTIYIRVVSEDGCVITTGITLDLVVLPLPAPVEPEPMVVCDVNTDGHAAFDIDSKIPEILNGELGITITFHETLAQAEQGLFPIINPYTNITQYNQTIYVRAENDQSGCYSIVELELIVDEAPVIPVPGTLEPLVECADDASEPLADATAVFDLTEHLEEIYGTQSQDDYILTFHLTETAAQTPTGAITDPENYVNISNPQTIWFRLENGETGCGSVGSFEIEVALPPDIADPTPLSICEDADAQGYGLFDLTLRYDEITINQPGLDVQYYEDEIDAIEGNEDNRINPDNAFTNTIPYLQDIYVRVVDQDTGCASLTVLLLRVEPNPDIVNPTPLEVCNETNPGTGIEEDIDLTQKLPEILNQEDPNLVDVSYHETLDDALLGNNDIPDPTSYDMIEAPHQTIWVRVEFIQTGCYSIVELLIIVNPVPEIDPQDVEDYVLCEDPVGTQGVFDLLTKRSEILALLAPDQDQYTVTFHEVAGDETQGVNAIPEFQLPNYQSNVPATLYFRIEHIDTGCYTTGSFELRIELGAEATAPNAPIEVCEDEQGSGIGMFNLSLLDDILLNGLTGYNVNYYETLADAEAGVAITDPSNYQSPSTTIYGGISNQNCESLVEIDLQVNPLPVLQLQEEYRLCVDENGQPIMEEFGELSPPVIDTELDENQYSFVWLLDGSVLFGENGPSITVSEPGEYSVIVTDMATGCENQASTTVIISSPPLVYGAEATTLAFSDHHAIEAWVTDGLGEYIFRLDDGAYQDHGIFENVSPGVHIVTITDVNGCGSVQIEVGVIDYPLYFTPNNDTYHDTWNIIGIAVDPNAKIYIFDRHGKLIKQLSPTGPGWDGTYNGNPMPSNDYWFKVIYEEDNKQKEFRGHFTLKR